MEDRERARQFFTEHGSTVDKAVNALLGQITFKSKLTRVLVSYIFRLGFSAVKNTMRGDIRRVVKNTGRAPEPVEVLRPGPVTGSVRRVFAHSPKTKTEVAGILIGGALDNFMIGETPLRTAGEAVLEAWKFTARAEIGGKQKNIVFADLLIKGLHRARKDTVGEVWTDETIKSVIQEAYGEFRERPIGDGDHRSPPAHHEGARV
jgi:hypothetical protein